MKWLTPLFVASSFVLLVSSPPAAAVPASSLLSLWEAEGDATDSEGGNDGALVNGATFGAGVSGQAFSLDGDDDAVIIPNSASLQLQDFTISAWVRRGDADAAGDGPTQFEGVVLSFGEDGWGLGMWGGGGAPTNGSLFLTRIGVTNVDSGTLAVADTASFHHVAVSKSGTEVVFYVDGVPTSPVIYDEVFSFTSDLGIGVRGDQLNGGSNFLGLIDDVALYERALTQQEIDTIVFGPLCGDGVLDTSEVCDDGNTVDGDSCNANCTSPFTPISPEDVLASWTSHPAPQWNFANEATDWVLVAGGVAQRMNGADTRVSDFGFSGDFTFTGIFRAIQQLNGFQDDDNFGVVFGWQDEANHYRLGWEGGGFGDIGDEFDPFVDEGASGARGIWLVREQGGVGTFLFEAPAVFWTPETDYGFRVSRSGDEIAFEVTEGVAVVASTTVVDTTFPSGSIGIYVEEQETEFRDLAGSEPDVEGACPAEPEPACILSAKASLSVKESKAGKEKLKLKLGALGSATTQQSFGDPVSGNTSYAVCLYGAEDALVAALTVGPGGTCGPKSKACWKANSTKGYAFKDPDAAQSGVRKLKAKAGASGKGKLQLQAGNKSSKGQDSLPVEITAGLQGLSSALVQLRTSDAECFEASLDSVKKADPDQFKAKTQ